MEGIVETLDEFVLEIALVVEVVVEDVLVVVVVEFVSELVVVEFVLEVVVVVFVVVEFVVVVVTFVVLVAFPKSAVIEPAPFIIAVVLGADEFATDIKPVLFQEIKLNPL